MPTPVENPPPLNRYRNFPYTGRRFPVEILEAELARVPVPNPQPAKPDPLQIEPQ